MLFCVSQDKIPNSLGPFPWLLRHYRDINMSPADVCSDGAAAVPKERRISCTRPLHQQSSAPLCSQQPRTCMAERKRGDSTEDFIGWKKWNKDMKALSSWDP